MMKTERRTRKRVPVVFEAIITVAGRTVRAETHDISLKGMLCSTGEEFIQGDSCEIIIQLAPDVCIAIQGMVARTAPEHTALMFSSMDEESFAHLRRLVQYNACDADIIDEELHIPAFS
jgi:c-di-GMP-binding flagellar brake protein YcgR